MLPDCLDQENTTEGSPCEFPYPSLQRPGSFYSHLLERLLQEARCHASEAQASPDDRLHGEKLHQPVPGHPALPAQTSDKGEKEPPWTSLPQQVARGSEEPSPLCPALAHITHWLLFGTSKFWGSLMQPQTIRTIMSILQKRKERYREGTCCAQGFTEERVRARSGSG